MKLEEYNPKAREAFAKSLIDIGVAIFKSIMLLVTVVPASVVVKAILDGKKLNVSLLSISQALSSGTVLVFSSFALVGILVGYYFRKEGLRHLHELENT